MQQTITTRGEGFAKKRPAFFEVLSNLWNPETNGDGIVNIGLAENVCIAVTLLELRG